MEKVLIEDKLENLVTAAYGHLTADKTAVLNGNTNVCSFEFPTAKEQHKNLFKHLYDGIFNKVTKMMDADYQALKGVAMTFLGSAALMLSRKTMIKLLAASGLCGSLIAGLYLEGKASKLREIFPDLTETAIQMSLYLTYALWSVITRVPKESVGVLVRHLLEMIDRSILECVLDHISLTPQTVVEKALLMNLPSTELIRIGTGKYPIVDVLASPRINPFLDVFVPEGDDVVIDCRIGFYVNTLLTRLDGWIPVISSSEFRKRRIHLVPSETAGTSTLVFLDRLHKSQKVLWEKSMKSEEGKYGSIQTLDESKDLGEDMTLVQSEIDALYQLAYSTVFYDGDGLGETARGEGVMMLGLISLQTFIEKLPRTNHIFWKSPSYETLFGGTTRLPPLVTRWVEAYEKVFMIIFPMFPEDPNPIPSPDPPAPSPDPPAPSPDPPTRSHAAVYVPRGNQIKGFVKSLRDLCSDLCYIFAERFAERFETFKITVDLLVHKFCEFTGITPDKGWTSVSLAFGGVLVSFGKLSFYLQLGGPCGLIFVCLGSLLTLQAHHQICPLWLKHRIEYEELKSRYHKKRS